MATRIHTYFGENAAELEECKESLKKTEASIAKGDEYGPIKKNIKEEQKMKVRFSASPDTVAHFVANNKEFRKRKKQKLQAKKIETEIQIKMRERIHANCSIELEKVLDEEMKQEIISLKEEAKKLRDGGLLHATKNDDFWIESTFLEILKECKEKHDTFNKRMVSRIKNSKNSRGPMTQREKVAAAEAEKWGNHNAFVDTLDKISDKRNKRLRKGDIRGKSLPDTSAAPSSPEEEKIETIPDVAREPRVSQKLPSKTVKETPLKKVPANVLVHEPVVQKKLSDAPKFTKPASVRPRAPKPTGPTRSSTCSKKAVRGPPPRAQPKKKTIKQPKTNVIGSPQPQIPGSAPPVTDDNSLPPVPVDHTKLGVPGHYVKGQRVRINKKGSERLNLEYNLRVSNKIYSSYSFEGTEAEISKIYSKKYIVVAVKDPNFFNGKRISIPVSSEEIVPIKSNMAFSNGELVEILQEKYGYARVMKQDGTKLRIKAETLIKVPVGPRVPVAPSVFPPQPYKRDGRRRLPAMPEVVATPMPDIPTSEIMEIETPSTNSLPILALVAGVACVAGFFIRRFYRSTKRSRSEQED